MYGLVNKGLQDFILSQFGHGTWDEIKAVAHVTAESFVSMHQYPDTVTYGLIQAAAQVLGMSQELILEQFGEYWILYTAKVGYGPLLEMAGSTLKEFLSNLDALHTRVGLAFPQLEPPSFRCVEIDEQTLQLHYYSKRRGLGPMVIGLVRGLGKRFETPASLSQLPMDHQDGDHLIFLVGY